MNRAIHFEKPDNGSISIGHLEDFREMRLVRTTKGRCEMTLTEAVKAWSDAMTDSYMYDLRGFESEAAEARQLAIAVKPLLLASVAQAEAAERVAKAVERWRCEAHAANWQAIVNCLNGYDVAKEAVRKLEEANKSPSSHQHRRNI